jgi:hypothetical protein
MVDAGEERPAYLYSKKIKCRVTSDPNPSFIPPRMVSELPSAASPLLYPRLFTRALSRIRYVRIRASIQATLFYGCYRFFINVNPKPTRVHSLGFQLSAEPLNFLRFPLRLT